MFHLNSPFDTLYVLAHVALLMSPRATQLIPYSLMNNQYLTVSHANSTEFSSKFATSASATTSKMNVTRSVLSFLLSAPSGDANKVRFGDTEVFLKHETHAVYFGQDRETDASVWTVMDRCVDCHYLVDAVPRCEERVPP